MIYTFFQQASTSNFPSTSGLTEWVSECVRFGVCLCMCAHVYVFGQVPIKQLMLAVFHHCEMGKWLSVSPLALYHMRNTKVCESTLLRNFLLFFNNLSIISP